MKRIEHEGEWLVSERELEEVLALLPRDHRVRIAIEVRPGEVPTVEVVAISPSVTARHYMTPVRGDITTSILCAVVGLARDLDSGDVDAIR